MVLLSRSVRLCDGEADESVEGEITMAQFVRGEEKKLADGDGLYTCS